ncbi:hypothetical protein ACFFWD_42495 [Bradyrhizobium erythrophlei]|uniref:hypothetical protein n=1 Tax=Bradyrhizobium erythrophlei TaxID=1437360 RepID=UPI0035EE6FD7
MKRTVFGVVPLVAAACLGGLSSAQASPAKLNDCIARVLHSEELPYAPIGYWLVKVTLEVTPSSGPQFVKTVLHNVPWQQSSPRRGETYRLKCSPPNELVY